MVAAISQPPIPSQNPQTTHQENPSRTPKDNGVVARKPRGRQVSSRYLSPSTSSPSSSSSSSITAAKTESKTTARYPSSLVSRSKNSSSTSTPAVAALSSIPKRSQSVELRRSGPPALQGNGNAAELSAATKLLITSTRSLSVSFQGEAFLLPISKKKAQVAPTLSRKPMPERQKPTLVRDHGENLRSMDQHPARTRQGNSGLNPLSMIVDCGSVSKRFGGFGSGSTVIKSLQQSMMFDESNRRFSVGGTSRLNLDLGNAELLNEGSKQNQDANSVTEASCVSCDFTESGTDSVSSGSTNSDVQECGAGISRGKSLPHGFVVSPKFWQETNSRLRSLRDPGSALCTSQGSSIGAQSKFSQSKRFSSDAVSSSPRTVASSIRATAGPASRSKHWTSLVSSPLRGLGLARVRAAIGGGINSASINTSSILSFSVDIRRGKIGDKHIIDAQLLRLLDNRYLQWRFANARADATFMAQKLTAEMLYLEEWTLLDRNHSDSLLGATEALKASTLRLPVVGKAKVDIQNVKDAVGSAMDVAQAMAFSICTLSSKVEEMNMTMVELMNFTEKERSLLEQCRDILSTLTSMQVKVLSMRTHIIQLNRPSKTTA